MHQDALRATFLELLGHQTAVLKAVKAASGAVCEPDHIGHLQLAKCLGLLEPNEQVHSSVVKRSELVAEHFLDWIARLGRLGRVEGRREYACSVGTPTSDGCTSRC